MDQIHSDEELPPPINIKRPFIPKFFKELNHNQNEKHKKSKRKMKLGISAQKLQKIQRIGIPNIKSNKKLPEVTRNGNRIIANWKNDQIDGEAEVHYHNGVVFKGIYQNGMKVKGHFKFLNGYEYIGKCLGNKFHGEGSLIFPSGKIIEGEWKNYNLIGKGKIQYPQGEVYYGDIINFKKHGNGYLFFSDGSKYVGEFSEGLITGKGTYYVNDEAVSSGCWEKGQLVRQFDVDEEGRQLGSQNDSFQMNELDDRKAKKVHFAQHQQ